MARVRILFALLLFLGTVGAAAVIAEENRASGSVSSVDEELDGLFADLKTANDPQAAKALEKRIWSAWLQSGSPTVDLLIARASKAMQSKDFSLAMEVLNTAIELKPDYAEGWNKRATLHYMMKNYGESIGDIQRTLAIEPRHFGAMSGLGSILKIYGDDKGALEIYRRALDVYPLMENAGKEVEKLAEDVEGRGI